MSTKRINLVGLNIEHEELIDADDYGHRLTECMQGCSTDCNVVNLIKIKLGEKIKAYDIEPILKPIQQHLKDQGLNNVVFVPLIKGFIEDINIDYIEVTHV